MNLFYYYYYLFYILIYKPHCACICIVNKLLLLCSPTGQYWVSSLYSLFSLGSLPVCWPAKCWVESFPELDWVGNSAECPSSGCHSAPAMGRVWGGRNQWGSAPLLVQCPTGSPSFWTQAGPQLCRRGSQCPKTDSSKWSQLLHTQLGQYRTMTLTWMCTHMTRHCGWPHQANMTSPSSGNERICICITPPSEEILANLTKYGAEGGLADLTGQQCNNIITRSTDFILSYLTWKNSRLCLN